MGIVIKQLHVCECEYTPNKQACGNSGKETPPERARERNLQRIQKDPKGNKSPCCMLHKKRNNLVAQKSF